MKTCEHPEKPVAARCVVCGELLCQECRAIKKRKNYCMDCLPGKPKGFRSPTFSMILSLIPGLGQMYAGSFLKGLVFLVAGGSSLALQEGIPVLVPLAVLFLSVWDARMTAHKRNFRVTKGRSGTPGASEADWLLLFGTTGLAAFNIGLPMTTGQTMEPWALWISFVVVLALSALIGRGGKNVKTA